MGVLNKIEWEISSTLISEIANAWKTEWNDPNFSLKLIFAGKVLELHKTLGDYNFWILFKLIYYFSLINFKSGHCIQAIFHKMNRPQEPEVEIEEDLGDVDFSVLRIDTSQVDSEFLTILRRIQYLQSLQRASRDIR